MTIAIGVSCRTGAALVTDSMTMRTTPDGQVEGYLSADHKIGQSSHLAFVHSGSAVEGATIDPGQQGFVEQARELYAAIITATPPGGHHLPVEAGSNPVEMARLGEQDLIVAATEAGQPLRLAKLTRDGEEWAGPEGAIFIAGAPTIWAQERGLSDGPVPETPVGCADLAVSIAADFIAHAYGARTLEDFAVDGLIPPVAYPLHIMVITNAGVARFEYSL